MVSLQRPVSLLPPVSLFDISKMLNFIFFECHFLNIIRDWKCPCFNRQPSLNRPAHAFYSPANHEPNTVRLPFIFTLLSEIKRSPEKFIFYLFLCKNWFWTEFDFYDARCFIVLDC
jgi:hypothetical protein